VDERGARKGERKEERKWGQEKMGPGALIDEWR
jgi:hypothetical protein